MNDFDTFIIDKFRDKFNGCESWEVESHLNYVKKEFIDAEFLSKQLFEINKKLDLLIKEMKPGGFSLQFS